MTKKHITICLDIVNEGKKDNIGFFVFINGETEVYKGLEVNRLSIKEVDNLCNRFTSIVKNKFKPDVLKKRRTNYPKIEINLKFIPKENVNEKIFYELFSQLEQLI